MKHNNNEATSCKMSSSCNVSSENNQLFDNRKESANFSFQLLFVTILFVSACFDVVKAERIEILMSNVTTQQEDAYICTSYKFADDQSYITNVEPLTNANIAHHMFAFGCDKPASTSLSWNCGDVVCAGQKTILFAWGRNAPSLTLPDDVAFKVGPTTTFKYIVVNVHYLKKVTNDRSGLAISVTNKPRRYQAGIMLLVPSYIGIPPASKKYSTRLSCKYTGKTLKAFAFRVHAHAHGDVNTAYRVRNDEWVQLAKGDPQWPQAFYPTDTLIDIKDGDSLLGMCTYHNDENKYVYAGPTHKDEMCNIYIMYYTDNTDDVMGVCSGNTYPTLEKAIPADAEEKPAPLASFISGDNSDPDNKNSHHDMEGSKLHHDTNSKNSNKDNFPLSYLLSKAGNNDDYYDDIEQSRSKQRTNNNKNSNSNSKNSNKYIDPVYNDITASGSNSDDNLYETNALLDAFGGDNGDDYQAPLDDTELLSAVAAKLNGNKKNNLNKIISKLPKTSVSINKYTNMENWYDAKSVKFGQIGGIAINQKSDTIVVFHRGEQVWLADSFNVDYQFNTRKYERIPTDTIITMNRNTGKIVNSWGANMFYMPHGLTLDSEGNIWVTDVGLHQVFKFTPDNLKKPALTLGQALVPGNDQTHFCQPADVAVLKSGDFFVADGYCNSRIVKFSKTGEFLSEWSSEDEKMPRHFFVPHALALHESQNLLCVADRENYRVQCFDLNGNFIHETKSDDFGPIYGVSFASNNGSILYAINGLNSRTKSEQYEKKVFLISVRTGNIIGSINLVADAKTPHDISVSDDASEIYIANLNPPTLFKYVFVNYKLGTIGANKQNKNSWKGDKQSNAEKENFKTSMFIMAFLAIPLILIVFVALIVRIKNAHKLKKANIVSFTNQNSESTMNNAGKKESKFAKWMSQKTNKNKRNGFTRLNQDSDNEETVHLNKKMSSNSNENDSDSSNDEVEITLPTISKA